MPVAGCCRFDKTAWPAGETALYFCQACRETLEAKPGNQLALENLFVWLAEQKDFPWPDYSGLTVNVQDCWRDREHPEIFDGARACLKKMGVAVIEMEENWEKSVFCGNLHFEPKKPENIALLQSRPGVPLYEYGEEEQRQLMAEQAEKLTRAPGRCLLQPVHRRAAFRRGQGRPFDGAVHGDLAGRKDGETGRFCLTFPVGML